MVHLLREINIRILHFAFHEQVSLSEYPGPKIYEVIVHGPCAVAAGNSGFSMTNRTVMLNVMKCSEASISRRHPSWILHFVQNDKKSQNDRKKMA